MWRSYSRLILLAVIVLFAYVGPMMGANVTVLPQQQQQKTHEKQNSPSGIGGRGFLVVCLVSGKMIVASFAPTLSSQISALSPLVNIFVKQTIVLKFLNVKLPSSGGISNLLTPSVW